MLIEEGRYINDYFGITRDILVKKNEVKIIFNAFLNDDLNFTFIKRYPSEKEARKKIENFIEKSKYLEAQLPYCAETIILVNKSIHSLISDILGDKVNLPDEDYEFMGNKSYLKVLTDKNVEFVHFE